MGNPSPVAPQALSHADFADQAALEAAQAQCASLFRSGLPRPQDLQLGG